jgi:hypothetical protein
MRNCSAWMRWSATPAPRSSEIRLSTALTLHMHTAFVAAICSAADAAAGAVCNMHPSHRPRSNLCRMFGDRRALDLKGGGPIKKVSAQYRRPQRRSTGSSYSDQLLQVHLKCLKHFCSVA